MPRFAWLVVLALGIAVSGHAAATLASGHERHWWGEFERHATTRVELIRDRLRLETALLATVQGFHEASREVEPHEAQAFLGNLRGGLGTGAVLVWVHRVPGDAVPSLAEAARKAGLPDIALRRHDATAGWVPVALEGTHGVVLGGSPPQAAATLAGWDLLAQPEVAPTLLHAAASGAERASPAIVAPRGLASVDGGRTVVVAQPVYGRPTEPGGADARSAARAVGWVACFLEPGPMAADATSPLVPVGIDTYLEDVTPGAPATPLAAVASRLREDDGHLPPLEAVAAAVPRLADDFPFAGRAWRVTVVAVGAFARERRTIEPWAVLGGGILLSCALAFALRGYARREAVIRREVAARTADLSRANQDLQTEVAMRREAQASLAQQTDLLETILASLAEGVIACDPDRRVTFLSPAASEWTGWPRGEARGRPVDEVVALLDEVAAVPVSVEALCSRREGAAQRPCTAILRSRAGGDRPVQVRTRPVVGREGRVVGGLLLLHDLSEARTREAALAEQEALFGAFSRETPDGLLLVDVEDPAAVGSILHANEAAGRIHGVAGEDLVGRSLLDFVPREEAPAVRERLLALRDGGTAAVERPGVRADGTVFPAEAIARGIRWRGRRTVLAILRDITQRRRAEEERVRVERQVQHAQRLESLGVLAGGIAHDFNNLLLGVLGNADLALLDLPEDAPVRARVQDVKRAALRAADLTQRMLAYAGKGRVLVEPVDLNEVVRDMARLLAVSLGPRVRLELDLAEGLPPVEADASQMRQVFMNLVTNASEAMGDRPGTIRARTEAAEVPEEWLVGAFGAPGLAPGRFVVLEVSDDGPGMDAATQRRVFEPFFTTKFAGRGLGLPALLGIVRSHCGAVRFASEPGRGTTFRVALPPGSRAPVPPPAARPAAPGARAGAVLAVDDEASVREVLRAALARSGHRVALAASGEEAVEHLRSHGAPDLVLLDTTMPGMDGVATYDALRALAPGLRVLVLSGHAPEDARARFGNRPLAGFVSKPFEVETLLAAVSSSLP